jgi:quinol-cytochrome oxidoreductase complex cytochrome b subunit
MLENYSVDQKKVVIAVFGIFVVVLAGINRFFLKNMAMSAVVVTLIIVFFVVLIWFTIHSRRVTSQEQPKPAKRAEKQKRKRKS